MGKRGCNGVEGKYETWDDGEKRGMYYRRGNGVEGKYETWGNGKKGRQYKRGVMGKKGERKKKVSKRDEEGTR